MKNISPKIILGIVALLIVSIGWYGNMDSFNMKIKTKVISYNDVEVMQMGKEGLFKYEVDLDKNYYSKQKFTYKYTRTYIPFILRRELITKSSIKYYSQ